MTAHLNTSPRSGGRRRRGGDLPGAVPGRGGFTLIEVVLALSIVASIIVIVWGSIGASFESRDYMMKSFDQFLQIRLAVDRMSKEFSSAYITVHANKRNNLPSANDLAENDLTQVVDAEEARAIQETEQAEALEQALQDQDVILETAFVGKRDEVHFTSLSHVRTQRNEKASDQCEIAYFVRQSRRRSPDGRFTRELVRREDASLDDDVESGGVIYTLIDDVTDVEFEYWEEGSDGDEEGGGQWVDNWDSRNFDQRGKLPSRVKITVTVPIAGNKRDKTRTFVSQAPIMMTRILDF